MAQISLCICAFQSEPPFPVYRIQCKAPDKTEHPECIFLISAQKHLLWILIRGVTINRYIDAS